MRLSTSNCNFTVNLRIFVIHYYTFYSQDTSCLRSTLVIHSLRKRTAPTVSSWFSRRSNATVKVQLQFDGKLKNIRDSLLYVLLSGHFVSEIDSSDSLATKTHCTYGFFMVLPSQ